jgi:glycerol-3-phosphate acyltransferase PlsX
MPVEIVVDGMGSDKAPESEIRGAILASRLLDVDVTLVGPEDILQPALDKALEWRIDRWGQRPGRPIKVLHACAWG